MTTPARIPMSSVNRNFENINHYKSRPRTELSIAPTKAPLNINQQSPDLKDKHQKARNRNIRILRKLLEGQSMEQVAEYYAITPALARTLAAEILKILYFRAADRVGLTEPPRGIAPALANPAFWLEKLNDTEDLLKVLDPSKLPTQKVNHDKIPSLPARPVGRAGSARFG